MSAKWLLIVLAGAAFAQQWTPELQMQVKLVGDVVPSPDGKMAAWTQTRAVIETEKSEQVTEIFAARPDGSERKMIGRGSGITWSADSRYLFYQSGRVIWRIPQGADAAKEAEAVLEWKGSLGTYAISPNGRMIAFTGLEPDSEAERARKEKRDWMVVGANPRNHALWALLIGASSKPARISTTTKHVGGFAWSPDGRSIAFETRPTPEANLASRSDIFEVDIASKEEKAIAATAASESQPRYSPDGKYLAFVRSAVPVRSAGDDHIVLHPRDGRAERKLPDTYDRLPKLLGWSGDRILYEEGRATRNAIYAMPIDGPPKLIYAPAGVLSGYRLNGSGNQLGFVRESSSEAPEAFVKSVESGEPVRLSAANSELPKLPLGETKVLWWRSKDNTEVEGLLTLPVGYQKGQKVPMVLLLHGGPYGANTEQFLGRPGLYPLATFSARGIAVLRPNPRASTGYGRDFRFLNLKDWGGGDYEDVMAGVDLAIRDGVADPNKLTVMGWSYGGYLTSWTISHTNRFKAAAVGAGVENLISQTGTADIRNNKLDAFGAPWDDREYYIQRSPITHVKNVKTPTLILGGEQDDRVPISQSYELYHALEARGVEAQMVVYPRTPHGPREPKFQLDIMQRHLDWVEKHVR